VKSIALIHLPTRLVTNRFVNKPSRYEKSNVIERCCSHRRPDAGFVLKHAGDDHNHNASNYGHGPAATAYTNDDYNDSHGRRLLIDKAARGCVCCWHGLVAVAAFQKQR
jgi:hypothetical protein